jgi:hypothetical protein
MSHNQIRNTSSKPRVDNKPPSYNSSVTDKYKYINGESYERISGNTYTHNGRIIKAINLPQERPNSSVKVKTDTLGKYLVEQQKSGKNEPQYSKDSSIQNEYKYNNIKPTNHSYFDQDQRGSSSHTKILDNKINDTNNHRESSSNIPDYKYNLSTNTNKLHNSMFIDSRPNDNINNILSKTDIKKHDQDTNDDLFKLKKRIEELEKETAKVGILTHKITLLENELNGMNIRNKNTYTLSPSFASGDKEIKQLQSFHCKNFTTKAFYECIADRSNLIFLMTNNNTDNFFGCFISKQISLISYTRDKNAYIFSQNKDGLVKKYKIRPQYSHQAVFINSDCLFGLGNVDLLISKDCFSTSQNNCYCAIGESYSANADDYKNITRTNKFFLTSLEIFEIN